MYKAHIDRVILANARALARALARTHMMITHARQIRYKSDFDRRPKRNFRLLWEIYNWNVFFLFFSLPPNPQIITRNGNIVRFTKPHDRVIYCENKR